MVAVGPSARLAWLSRHRLRRLIDDVTTLVVVTVAGGSVHSGNIYDLIRVNSSLGSRFLASEILAFLSRFRAFGAAIQKTAC
ncbi:hypothetical protein J5N97_017052 [Dioscorea zingiberensis]|uniref:Uncharacterized protein n=1 Tax=Dioscorea zingiberensis TaxID=325984 RepID=A0A9D5CMF9_9LILI|nr:hypothetical protein J5N97_017052 [Dioscorea zingiberensis]